MAVAEASRERLAALLAARGRLWGSNVGSQTEIETASLLGVSVFQRFLLQIIKYASFDSHPKDLHLTHSAEQQVIKWSKKILTKSKE